MTELTSSDIDNVFNIVYQSDIEKPVIPQAMVKQLDGTIDVTCTEDRHLRVFLDEDKVVEL